MTDQKEGSFNIDLKEYNDKEGYDAYITKSVAFDPACLTLESVHDIQTIMNEINALSYKLYFYGYLCDMQARVLQEIEDEFNKWMAQKYFVESVDDKQFKTEKSKERHIYMTYMTEYTKYEKAIANEKYKLSLLQRVVKSLENFGYKLHDLKDYNMTIGRNM